MINIIFIDRQLKSLIIFIIIMHTYTQLIIQLNNYIILKPEIALKIYL